MSKKIRHPGQKPRHLPWKLPKHPFDYTFLMNLLENYNSPRDKISRMIKKKEIIQVKKGLYAASPEFGAQIDLKVLANLIYGPSYISLEYALSYWGLIPEKVAEVTSMTNKRNKVFDTPLGFFSYKYLENSKFSTGIERISEASGAFLIAAKEKALCDRLALVKELETGDMAEFLEAEMRLDMTELDHFDVELVREISSKYRRKPVTAFFKWLRERDKKIGQVKDE
ncbi:MAG: hypothetical protein KAW12_04140 [Candidatus Aminicenantes bacterium]|nr:hypothetical protein [Candidatus Aminicenantes bacterium]